MKVGLIGVGRMGQVLAARLAPLHQLYVYDRNLDLAEAVAAQTGAVAVKDLAELVTTETIILAVPDREVLSLIIEFNNLGQPVAIIKIATNVAQPALEAAAASHVRCLGAKIVGQAGEMAQGSEPVIIINHTPLSMVPLAQELFAAVGKIVVGRADMVIDINTLAVKYALEAAVRLETELENIGLKDRAVINSAIRQVAAGTLKAYADNNLGPFARDIIRAIRARLQDRGRQN